MVYNGWPAQTATALLPSWTRLEPPGQLLSMGEHWGSNAFKLQNGLPKSRLQGPETDELTWCTATATVATAATA